MYDVQKWRHVFKLDPNKEISDKNLERICESGTDAIIIGGTDGVTLENVLSIMSRVRRYTVPCVLEISSIESVTPGFDLYFVPTVLNSTNTLWVTGLHQKAVKEYGEIINWDEFLMQGYCILNKECKAANVTEANTELSEDDVAAFAMMAEKMFHLPIFYVEYSGSYGNPEMVKAAKRHLMNTTLFYGGGIANLQEAEEMASIADVVVVGNIIYTDIDAALSTVQIKG
ncbi:heptaprenylglyceryl phosphate synthase [Niallia sp. NCCP-28]|uniref:heptaprenylglyceryl phosphate synthase n=1 Tax=Niallia sp. NCCP-28 TaxID=2934712 RepID=UPI0020827A7C|nr:heptaprenylglyceryl phosphate synthase [Niallia sp. NCCP-28]GKU84508.1 heptaprenylglyceryl phosphate synthase [Niallia sp. NCCP-28]